MDTTPPATPASQPGQRWRFLRDVLIFQFKMLLGNFRDFALVPISLLAAVADLFLKNEREGHYFYKVMRWAWHSEEMINVYGLIKHEVGGTEVHPDHTIDAVISRIENAVVREYESGATAAGIKEALGKAIDQVHREMNTKGDQVRGVLVQTRRLLELRDKKD
jgi:hypothetical protein